MQGTYFDGQTAQAHLVELRIENDRLVVTGEGIDRREPVAAVEITDAVGSTHRVVRFVGGASCEIADVEAFRAMLVRHGVRHARVDGWEKSWLIGVAAVLVLAAAVFLAYRYAFPAMARTAAHHVPPSALDTLSGQVLRALDRTVFTRANIDGRRLAALLNAFDAFTLPPGAQGRLKLEFRHSSLVGANAMALPSGIVVVTDDLVYLTKDDRILLAVLAHEAGHVDRRHGLRQIIQSSLSGLLATWLLGDVTALGAVAPSALMDAKYSRDLEREADAYAAQVLKTNGLSPSLLADALELIMKSHGADGGNDPLVYLSSHPATEERLAWLRSQ
jgi:Zn-dependent protease with chaperone function